MSTNAQNVVVALTGGIFLADAGVALPTEATSELGVDFAELGYVTEEGVTQTIDESTTKIRSWQGGDTVREVQTAHDLTYQFTCLESNEAVQKAFYGNFSAGTIEINGAPGTRGRWIIQVKDGNKDLRIVIPDGQITDRGDVSYVASNAVTYPITITCYPDPDYDGELDFPAKAYIYQGAAASE